MLTGPFLAFFSNLWNRSFLHPLSSENSIFEGPSLQGRVSSKCLVSVQLSVTQMSHRCPTNVPQMSHICPTYIQQMSHICPTTPSLDTHWGLTGDSLDAHWTLTGRSLGAHWNIFGFVSRTYGILHFCNPSLAKTQFLRVRAYRGGCPVSV